LGLGRGWLAVLRCDGGHVVALVAAGAEGRDVDLELAVDLGLAWIGPYEILGVPAVFGAFEL
jgi:hypothetical protein